MAAEKQVQTLAIEPCAHVNHSGAERTLYTARYLQPLYGAHTTFGFTYEVLKRILDVCVVLLISPLAVTLGLVIALCIAFDSRGPIFFSHRRIKRGGEYFSMWKFRTMCPDASEALQRHFAKHPKDRDEWKRCHKLKNDPRISAFGKFLRRSSLDEIPQLWNVLTGDMSLVGPRPIVYDEVEKYGSDYGYYISVRPGITGLWQTSGRSTLTYDERVKLDRRYVESWNLMLELRILLRTFRCIVDSDGAY